MHVACGGEGRRYVYLRGWGGGAARIRSGPAAHFFFGGGIGGRGEGVRTHTFANTEARPGPGGRIRPLVKVVAIIPLWGLSYIPCNRTVLMVAVPLAVTVAVLLAVTVAVLLAVAVAVLLAVAVAVLLAVAVAVLLTVAVAVLLAAHSPQ